MSNDHPATVVLRAAAKNGIEIDTRMPAHCFFDQSRAIAEQHWQCPTIDVALMTAIVYFFFDFASP